MDWKHKCDLTWLRARQEYLTASEIRALVPVTKTGRPRKVTELDYMRVYANKCVNLTEEDCWSYGAAARGHLLEPYAIDELNMALDDDGVMDHFYWWDDKLVSVGTRKIAFSPDAMDVSMGEDVEDASCIAEVKCYGAERHMVTAYTKKDQIEERWQIATAMALLDNISHAYLVLFNPSLDFESLYYIKFERFELSDEIDMIRDVEKEWTKFIHRLVPGLPNGGVAHRSFATESDIVRSLEIKQQEESLNP